MSINIIKGIDRIAILLAIVGLVPAFNFGMIQSQEFLKKPNPEYIHLIEKLRAVEEELNKKADAMSEKHLGVNILVLKLEYERMFERQYEFKPSLSYRLLEKTGKYSRIDKLRDKYIDLNFKINHRSLSAAQVNAYLYPTQKILFGVSALIAISCSVAFFLIVKITTRSIKGLGLWILKGFKE